MPKPRFLKLEPEQQRDILQNAAVEFAEHGLEAASMNQIIARCGVSKGAMYYYFSGKEDLYRTVLQHSFGELRQVLHDIPQPQDVEQFWPQLRAFFALGLRWFRANPAALTLFEQAITAHTGQDGVPVGLEALAEHLAQPMAALLDQGQTLGSVRRDLPTDILLQILYQTGTTCGSWLLENEQEDEQRLDSVFNLLERSLCPPAPRLSHAPDPPEREEPVPVAPHLFRHLQQLGERLWIADGSYINAMGIPLPTRMIVVLLDSGELWLHSPIKWSRSLEEDLLALGPVAHLVSPNKYHHLFLKKWHQQHPQARVWASPGLATKRRDLDFTGQLGAQAPADWEGQIEQIVFGGSFVYEELVFYHPLSKTLMVTDLIMNLDPKALPWPQRRLTHLIGAQGGTLLPLRPSFRDKNKALASLERIMGWDFDKVALSHGKVVEQDARAFVQRAFSWLRG